MSNVAHDTTIDNTVANDQVDGTPTGGPDNALSATAAEQEKLDAYRKEEDEVVDLAIATLDPKDMLKKYAKLGQRARKLAKRRKDSLAPGAWNGQADLK